MHRRRRRAALLAVPLLAGRTAIAQVPAHDPAGHALGTVHFTVSCSNTVQAQFDHAVALLHHMTYPEARRAFEQVAQADPRCAMAHWGVAMTLFQPLWPTRPDAQALRRGWEEARRATALGAATERERRFIAAVEAFFLEPEASDYWARIRRWEQAMEATYGASPDDLEAAAFYALAHLAAAPPGAGARAHADRAAEILTVVYRRNPDHPGAMHYLVHANDVPGREHELLEVTHRYDSLAPGNPHALHMPTHIYTRLGDWNAVIGGNLRAADAALAHPAGEQGDLVWDEFPHAIEYLIYAYLQQGADREAARQVDRLWGTPRLEPTFKTAFHLASTRARLALERDAWDEAASLTPRQPTTLDWDRFPWPEAVTWFARGLGAARLGQVDQPGAAVERLAALESKATGAGEALFATNIRILRLEVSAWLAWVRQRPDSSVALMNEAAALEVATPKHAVTPAPTLPAHELLGDLLLAQGRAADALAAYRRSLELYPRRYRSLLGAARAARAGGDADLARTFFQALLEIAGGTDRRGAAEARQATR
jgi:tetratricopeptide (TPR) repeat protein